MTTLHLCPGQPSLQATWGFERQDPIVLQWTVYLRIHVGHGHIVSLN